MITLAKWDPICDFWISFKPEFQALFLMDPLQMFSLLTGWHPAVTDGGHSGSNWTISGPSLCFSELRPQWSGLLFSFVLQSFTVDIQDGLVVWACWSLSSHSVSHHLCFFVLWVGRIEEVVYVIMRNWNLKCFIYRRVRYYLVHFVSKHAGCLTTVIKKMSKLIILN